MIDTSTLDEILPLPDIDTLKEEKLQELKDEGFVINNFSSGGIFYTLLMIILQIRIEIIKLLRNVLNNMFVKHASLSWLRLKAADYSKVQKAAIKVQGNVTVTRGSTTDAVIVPKGHVFKTIKDINGNELRYFVLTETILPQGSSTVLVPVEAEIEGAAYNVPAGQITRSLTYLDGCTVTNESDWITRAGSNVEDVESLRDRTLNSWASFATGTTAQKYQNACLDVPTVLYAYVDDQHPRGQGTIDIIITSTAGVATESLLDACEVAIADIKGTYDDVLIKSATVVTQPVTVTVTLSSSASDIGVEEQAIEAITKVMSISTDRDLNTLLHADIITEVKTATKARNVKVTVPETDITLESDKVVVLGTITVNIERS